MIDEKLLIEIMQWKMREAGTSDWNRCLDEVEKFIKEFPQVGGWIPDCGEFGQIESKRYLEHKQTAEWLRELQKYKDLEEQGRLITLPCKIGDTVYYREKDFNFAHPVKISEIILSDLGNNEKCFQFNGTFFDGNGDIYINYIDFEFDYDNFGKTVFLTKEEAEAALKGEEHDT